MEIELRGFGFRRRRERSSRGSPGGGGGGGDVASALCCLLLLCVFFPAGRVFGQTETSDWLHRAAALQRYIGYDIPLSSLTLTATHNSFSHDRNISTHANFEVVTAQVYSMTDQLSCLGVRGLEIDLHYIDELAVEGDEESAIRMCHASEDVAEQMVDLCDTFGWDVCEAADIFDYGEDTGCRPGAPTARTGFEEVASWLFLEENANEVLFLKLDSSLNDEDETVSTIVSDVFGEDVIFSPTDWEEFSGSDDWPSPAELVAMGTRVIIAGSESSTLVFSTDSDAVEVLIAPENFDTSECADVEGFPEPSWYRVQGDMVEYRLDRGNSTIFELVPGSDEALTSSMTDNVMNCGFTPTFDRLDADLMESTIWSWDTDRPETGFDLPRAAVISSDGGRWTDVETDSDSGERHSFACRSSDLRYDWTVVAVDTGSSGSSGSSSRRRRLTTTSTGDDDDDGSSASEIEFSDYSGEFSEADEACESVGYVFGAPRSAYENAILSFILSSAGLDSAWVDHTSEGESGGSGSSASGGSSLCWTHEGGSEYCVATSDGVCADVADPVTEVADGQLPDFLVREWEEDDYVRPDYTLSSTVQTLHSWVRVSGDNEFDLSERDYVIGIILAAVPVFVFGFIVACCCLPVGHVAASSKQHHVDGGGFFGCFCPARCKRGDFMGSGTLGVVVFFTIVTIIGGAAAIYGVQSVDGELVNMVSSLEDIGQAMGEAQTGVESIYILLTNVESSFEEVSSCSLVSSLEGVEAGIESAKLAVEELIEDDQLGSVSTNILELEEEFSNTQTTRRGVVYAAGALVLVMSVVYVSVGYYALGKDDGRGKAGGARMRGPVLIGCLILPLTLLVILLCWFLFGVSTSVALLTSDFCVDPSGHATEAFSKSADQELVAYYTSCEGANTFSDQLVTAYLQGSAAQGLLDALDDDELATECPDEVESKETLDENIVLILAQIDSLGYLVQCGSVNPYFVEGVEEALCTDAPDAIWFVICGFAVVSVGLFVVAVSFRLLLQQKEEGLYKVIFEDEIAASETSSSYSGRSDDSWSRANDLKKGSLAYDGGVRVQKGQEGSSSTPSTLPSSTPQAFGGGPHGVAAVTVSSASKDPQQQQQQRQKQAMAGGRGRSTPVELTTPLSRAAAAGGGGGGGRSGVPVEDFRRGGGYQEAAGARTGRGQRGAGSGAIARGRSRRSNGSSGNGRSGDGHIPMDNFASGKSSHSKLFRALAGLDDPEDEAPAVIVSRYANQRSTRNLGGPAGATAAGGGGGAASRGELSGSGQLRYAFGRASNVVGGSGSRRRNNAPAFDEDDEDSDMDNDFSDNDGGFGGGAAGGKGRGRGSLGERSSNGGGGGGTRKKSGRLSGGSGVSSAGVVAGPSAAATATTHGTWADFSRDCARRPDAPTLTSTDNAEIFRSSRELRRSSHARSAAVGDGATAAPGYDGRRGVPGGGAGAATTRGGRAAQHAGESKDEDGGQVPRRPLGDGRSGGGGAGTAKVSPRSWNKAGAGGGGGKGTAATSTATRTTTGMKGLSALSRPSPAETAAAESKQRRPGGPPSLGSSRRSGKSSGGRASRDEAAAAATRRVAAVTGTAPTASGRSGGSGSGGGGGGVPAGGGGASTRPGTRTRDAMKDRGGNGGGRG